MLAVSFFVTLSRNKVRMSPVRNHYQHLAVILAAIYERLHRGRAEPCEGQIVVTILHGMWKIIPLLYINTRKYMTLGKRELKICRGIQVQGRGRERTYSAHTVLPCIIRPPMT